MRLLPRYHRPRVAQAIRLLARIGPALALLVLSSPSSDATCGSAPDMSRDARAPSGRRSERFAIRSEADAQIAAAVADPVEADFDAEDPWEARSSEEETDARGSRDERILVGNLDPCWGSIASCMPCDAACGGGARKLPHSRRRRNRLRRTRRRATGSDPPAAADLPPGASGPPSLDALARSWSERARALDPRAGEISRFRFARWVLDPAKRLLTRGGKPVAVERKVLGLLIHLVAERSVPPHLRVCLHEGTVASTCQHDRHDPRAPPAPRSMEDMMFRRVDSPNPLHRSHEGGSG